MNLEKVLEFLFSNPENINIQYTYNNGEESLIINGEEVTTDNEIKELVENYKQVVSRIDDCDFLNIVEKIGESIDIKTFDSLIDQEHFSEEDARIIEPMIKYVNTIIKEYLENKIEDLKEILEMI